MTGLRRRAAGAAALALILGGCGTTREPAPARPARTNAELEAIYQFDYAFFDLGEQVGRALDNVEASLGDEAALPAAIRNVTSLARLAVETYNRRAEAVTGSGK